MNKLSPSKSLPRYQNWQLVICINYTLKRFFNFWKPCYIEDGRLQLVKYKLSDRRPGNENKHKFWPYVSHQVCLSSSQNSYSSIEICITEGLMLNFVIQVKLSTKLILTRKSIWHADSKKTCFYGSLKHIANSSRSCHKEKLS